ncbi:MAG: DUF4271 domain-containing protein [Muribaculaceae bacterium]|nr:DUF4271 domain-containing protein [Muribaculaceae bacterium]
MAFPAQEEITGPQPAPRLGIQLVTPEPAEPAISPQSKSDGFSWIVGALILVFAVVCVRIRRNSRYFALMLNDLTEVRERHNAFDDTLRETSFLWLLNLLWCGCAGVLLYVAVSRSGGAVHAAQIGICIGVAVVYTLFLTMAYGVVGSVFTSGARASEWVKGYLSSQALGAMVLFPAALLALCMPQWSTAMVVLGAIVYFLAKLLFIYKGFCIFFSQTASLVLFLYYLCSLEIVPVVLACSGAIYLCRPA